ncbi:MAG: MerR family transcriptional regulator [Holophagales bacterium]|nr:MerR family transcriptional regulator [Holophagales bacterium]
MAKKLFYKIGEACKLVDIQPYVLRYWETEFPFLQPDKSKSGQRVYSDRELAIIRRIKELLYEEGYTIAGAKKKLEGELAEDDDGKPVIAAPNGEEAQGSESDDDSVGLRRELDTAAEKLKTLRSGVEGALAEAHEILERLDPGAR